VRRGRDERDWLTGALLDLKVRGGTTPCADDPAMAIWWLSEYPEERAMAARLCAGCPVFAECFDAAEAGGERFGVWDGHDRTPRMRRRPLKGVTEPLVGAGRAGSQGEDG